MDAQCGRGPLTPFESDGSCRAAINGILLSRALNARYSGQLDRICSVQPWPS